MTWMTVGPVVDGKVEIAYSTPNLGFRVTKTVDEETARLLQIAKRAGRNEHIEELKTVMEQR